MNCFRKSMYSTVLIGALLSASPVFGVLPPLYSTLNEFKVLLATPQLTEKLNSGEMIRDIQRSADGFIIQTSQHTLKVDIVYDPQPTPGPARFHFVFNDPVPLEGKGM